MTIKPLLIILTLGALSSGAQAVIVSTADKDGDFMAAANWGGVDPKSKPDETYIISSGHTLALKVSGRTAAFPVKSVVISKGAVLNMSSSTLFDCSGKTLVLDGGELNMGGGSLNQMILDIRADSTVRLGGAGFGGGQVIGKGVLEFVRGGGKKGNVHRPERPRFYQICGKNPDWQEDGRSRHNHSFREKPQHGPGAD